MAALPENDRITGPFIALAGQTDFPADFPLIRAEGLRVRIRRDGQSDVILDGGDVVAVDEAPNGFTARIAARLAGDRVWVFSRLSAIRDRAHTPGGAIRTPTLEADATELQAQLQEQRRDLALTVSVAPGEVPPTPEDVRQAGLLAAGKANKNLSDATVQTLETGAVPRAVYIKARESLSVDDFNDVLIDDVTALERVFAAALNENNKLPVRQFKSLTIDAPLAIPSGLILTGPYASADHPIDGESWNASEGVLKVAPGVSISGGNAARVEKLRVIRLGLTQPTDAASSLAAVEAMDGTAFTAPNNIRFELFDLQIVGFDYAADMANNGRCHLSRLYIDCANGVRLKDSLDVSIIEKIHCWPWLTSGATGGDDRGLRRTGIAVDVGGGVIQNDFTQVLDCFSFGYGIGFQNNGGEHVSFANCASDNAQGLQFSPDPETAAAAAATIGVNIQGSARNTVITNFKGAAQGRTFVIQPTGRSPVVQISNPRSWATRLAHVEHLTGTLIIDSTAGFETPETELFDGHRILIGDGIDACEITSKGLTPPTIVASPTALAKTVITDERVTQRRLRNLVLNPKDAPFRAAGDGEADDTVAYQACLNAARAIDGSVGGEGVFRIVGTLDNAGVKIGWDQKYSRNKTALTDWGHVIMHDSPAGSLFQPTGPGWSLDGTTLYDPNQTGGGAVPVVRPPMITLGGSGAGVDWALNNIAVVNAYDFMQTNDVVGDARITSNRIYAIRRVYDVRGVVPEVIFEEGNIYSPGIYQSNSINFNGAMLANWTAKNGAIHYIDPGGTTLIEGWKLSNNFTYGYRNAWDILSGTVNLSDFTGENWDQVAQPIKTSGTGGINVIIAGGRGFCSTYGDTSVALAGFLFTGTGVHAVDFSGFTGQVCRGPWIDVNTDVEFILTIDGGRLNQWGLALGGEALATACIRINGALARVDFSPGYVQGALVNGIGLNVLNALNVQSSTTFDNIGVPIKIEGTVPASARVVDDSIVVRTIGANSYVNAADPAVLVTQGVYDKP